MNQADYNPNNIHAVLSRIEQKLNQVIEWQEQRRSEIEELKKARWVQFGMHLAAGAAAGGSMAHFIK